MSAQPVTGAGMRNKKDSGTLDNETKYFRNGFDSVIIFATVINQVLLGFKKHPNYVFLFFLKSILWIRRTRNTKARVISCFENLIRVRVLYLKTSVRIKP